VTGTDLDALRDEIDAINEDIVDAIATRMAVVRQISDQKEGTDQAVRDPEREAAVRDQFAALFTEEDLPEDRGRELAGLLIEMAVEAQR